MKTICMTFVMVMSFFNIAVAQDYMCTDDLKAKLGSSDLLILDVRPPFEWGQSDCKIYGAQWRNPGKVDKWADKLPKDKLIVVYCACSQEETSDRVAHRLMSKGLHNIKVLKGGLNKWLESRYPVDDK